MIARYTREAMGQLWTEEARFQAMLEVEILACEALARRGVVPRGVPSLIRRRARINVPRIHAIERTVKHDVIAFLTQVGATVGPSARYLHLGLTSSDVLDTGLSVQLVKASDLLAKGLTAVAAVVRRLAKRHRHTAMMGRTHGVHAEPITFGLKLAGWYCELTRDAERLQRAREIIRVGKLSGAVGTFSQVPPQVEAYVCRKLGLKPAPVSTQILQRDRHAEFLCQLAIVAASIEKFALEIRHLQRTEVLEAEEPFTEGQKGSSTMPHKQNPITCENLCGLARLFRGYVIAALEDVALWHERDISHSSVERVILPDATILLDFMLARFREVLEGLQVYPDRMRENMRSTLELIAAQRVMLRLTEAGMRREAAYALVQRYALKAWRERGSFLALVSADPQVTKRLSPTKLAACFDERRSFRHINTLFRRAGIREA
ncbi:MAG: adenylosuccinate lyase [Elusimicrobia bacterium]|nr:adenylosuccinate lyase [Elusimicrobiota bacterium]